MTYETDVERHQQIRELLSMISATARKAGREPRKDYYTDPATHAEEANIDQAARALELYQEFSKSSPDGIPAVSFDTAGLGSWNESEWYSLGVDDLVAASKVLQSFNVEPEAQRPVTEKLAALRAQAREVAEQISTAPSVHDSYYVGDRIVTARELRDMEASDSLFSCEINWGCYWQEKPEGTVAMFRQLITSPVFCSMHNDFWHAKPPEQRLVAWNDEDRRRIPTVWSQFVGELSRSTNILWQMEAKALVLADTRPGAEAEAARAGLVEIVRQHHDELVDKNVELFYAGWSDLPAWEALDEANRQRMEDKKAGRVRSATAENSMQSSPDAVFGSQVHFLAASTPFDFGTFNKVFALPYYTKAQAAELKPLVTAYESNLVAKAAAIQTMSVEKLQAQSNARWVQFYLVRQVDAALNPQPSAFRPQPQAASPSASGALPTKNGFTVGKSDLPPSEEMTNVVIVSKFLPIPVSSLAKGQITNLTITAHHWLEGKLVLDCEYHEIMTFLGENGNAVNGLGAVRRAIVILDPASEQWKVVGCPQTDSTNANDFYDRTTFWREDLYNSDGGEIRKYDRGGQRWEKLPVSTGDNYELFAVNDHLYGANEETIFEIVDNGNSTRILASTRRQPPASQLDGRELGTPSLFAGLGQTLRASTQDGIYAWTGEDWRKEAEAPVGGLAVEAFPKGVLFRHSMNSEGLEDSLSWLASETRVPELSLHTKFKPPNFVPGNYYMQQKMPAEDAVKPEWKLPPGFFLENLSAGLGQSNLYLLAGHSGIREIANDKHVMVREQVVTMDGYNALLLCFSKTAPKPQKVFLRFDDPDGCPPLAGVQPGSHSHNPRPAALMVVAGHKVLLASETPGGTSSIWARRMPVGYQAGVWVLPMAQIMPEIAAQQQAELVDAARVAAAAEEGPKNLLAKYDLNRDGVIDQDEKEQALDDPEFIKSELGRIDTNRNGWLEPSELAYFDANQNHILDPKEQAAIDIACHLLAERLVNRFDADEKGWLVQGEYSEMIQVTLHINDNASSGFQFPHVDENHDWRIDPEELSKALKLHLELELDPELGIPGRNRLVFVPMNGMRRLGADEQFKEDVELYWQYGDHANWPPYQNRMSVDPGFMPGRNSNHSSP